MKTSSILECSSLQDHFDRIDLVAHFPKHQPSAQRKARFFPRNDSHRSSSQAHLSAEILFGQLGTRDDEESRLGIEASNWFNVKPAELPILSFSSKHFPTD